MSSRTLNHRGGYLTLVSFAVITLLMALTIYWLQRGSTSPEIAPFSPERLKVRDTSKLPFYFEPNDGQTDPSVRFLARLHGSNLFFTPSDVTLSIPLPETTGGSDVSNDKGAPGEQSSLQMKVERTFATLIMQFVDANPSSISGGTKLPGKVNYLLGNDPARWHNDLPIYASITYHALYPGVDLVYTGNSGQLKGTYTVTAGSNPADIRWQYVGARNLLIDSAGNLQIALNMGNQVSDVMPASGDALQLTEHAPIAWQEIGGKRVGVTVQYALHGDNTIGFNVGTYDRSLPLFIDPVLTYSTYLGGNSGESGYGIAADGEGNTYVTGFTQSANFPVANPYQPTWHGDLDGFVTKFSPDGQTLVYSTFLGGNDHDEPAGLAIDGAGNAYIAGQTYSADFPMQNPYQGTLRGNKDAFISKLSASGSMLLYSTYLGGSSSDQAHGIAVDNAGSAYVIGSVPSTDFPTQNAYQPNIAGSYDVFVTKLSPSGQSLIYSTYLGGSTPEAPFQDYGATIAVDSAGSAYVSGFTSTTDFPVVNAFQPTNHGFQDTFITKFSPSGTTLVYSTYLGGSSSENGLSIAVDAIGNAYSAGIARSNDFPVMNAIQPTPAGGGDAYVTKLDPFGSALVYSTYYGGGNGDSAVGIAVDNTGNAYFMGTTSSTDFPLVNPIQAQFGGGNLDAYTAVLNAAGSAVIFSSYLGGSDQETANGAATDGAGNMYVTGSTFSTNFPIQNAYQPTPGGFSEGYVAKIAVVTVLVSPTIATTPSNTHTPPTSTNTPTATGTGTLTVPSSTSTVAATATTTSTPTATTSTGTPTSCTISFTDVPADSTFYIWIRCLACRGIISGYSDGTFKPGNEITRGQIAKMVSNAAGFEEDPGPQIYEDVDLSHTFYAWINRLSMRGHIGGYPCGGEGEPCGVDNRPYFRPFANATRGQLGKIVANAAGVGGSPTGLYYTDVPEDNPFYTWIMRLTNLGVMGGYPCGGEGEPCDDANRPYFRPFANVTRGQASKIVANTFYPGCQIPSR
jgi:hypothetical protein